MGDGIMVYIYNIVKIYIYIPHLYIICLNNYPIMTGIIIIMIIITTITIIIVIIIL